jgi:hypothetical protein
VVTVVVSADKDGGIAVDVESEESTGLDASIGIGKVSKCATRRGRKSCRSRTSRRTGPWPGVSTS